MKNCKTKTISLLITTDKRWGILRMRKPVQLFSIFLLFTWLFLPLLNWNLILAVRVFYSLLFLLLFRRCIIRKNPNCLRHHQALVPRGSFLQAQSCSQRWIYIYYIYTCIQTYTYMHIVKICIFNIILYLLLWNSSCVWH